MHQNVPPPVISHETTPIPPPVPPPAGDLSTRPLVSASIIIKDSNRAIPVPYKPAVYIGRADTSGYFPDIDLTDVDRDKVTSRKHGYISYLNGKYNLIDQGSMNGTYLNGVKLEKGKEYDLKNGDEIIFGKLVCIFSCAV